MLAIALTLISPRFEIAEDGGDTRVLVQFRQEIETLKGSEAAERRRVEQDEKHIPKATRNAESKVRQNCEHSGDQ